VSVVGAAVVASSILVGEQRARVDVDAVVALGVVAGGDVARVEDRDEEDGEREGEGR
jgi:hypothetical protein